jgi:hypothetical protein
MSGNPEKQVTEHATMNLKLPTTIPAKYQPVVLTRLPNEIVQKFTSHLPEVSEPTTPSQKTSDTSTPAAYRGEMRRARTPVEPTKEVLRPQDAEAHAPEEP